MHADFYFAQGKAHSVCQDYAWAGTMDISNYNRETMTAAIVSDGCSSSPDTDFGSRLLVQYAKNRLLVWQDNYNPILVARNVVHLIQSLGLHEQSLDATLLAAHERDDGKIEVSVCGDGVVIARDCEIAEEKEWRYDYITIEYSNNAPGYLSYLLSPQRKLILQDAINNHNVGIRTVDKYLITRTPGSFINLKSSLRVNLEEEKTFEEKFVFDPKLHDIVLVATDGIQSFQKKTEEGIFVSIPVREVIDEIIKFKVMTGRFLARRCMKFLNDFCVKNGWFHTDDLGIAAIYTGER